MTKFITQKLPIMALFVTSLLTPTTYAQQQTGPVTSAAQQQQAAVQNGVNAQKRVATDPFIRTELFFGADRPDGPDISEEEFQNFLDRKVSTEFPDGLTVLFGKGQFCCDAAGQIIQEKSFVLILLYPLESYKESNRKIEKIRADYKTEFKQQSVLRVDDPRTVRVSF